MSSYMVINKGTELTGKWYVKVLAFPEGTTPEDHPVLMSNLRNRDFIPITNAVGQPTVIRREHESSAVRLGCPPESVLGMVGNLAVCKCSNTLRWYIIGEMRGLTVLGKECITDENFFSLGYAGWKTHKELINVSYLTLDIDFSDTYQPLAISHYEELKSWCDKNKQLILKHILSS